MNLVSKFSEFCRDPCPNSRCKEGCSKEKISQQNFELQPTNPNFSQKDQNASEAITHGDANSNPEIAKANSSKGVESLRPQVESCPPGTASNNTYAFEGRELNTLPQPLNEMANNNSMANNQQDPPPIHQLDTNVLNSTETEKGTQKDFSASHETSKDHIIFFPENKIPKSSLKQKSDPILSRKIPQPGLMQNQDNNNSQVQPENPNHEEIYSDDLKNIPFQEKNKESSSDLQNNLPKEECGDTSDAISSRHRTSQWDFQSSVKKNKKFHKLNQRGFSNPAANECFANALLQVLYNLPEFRAKVFTAENTENQIKIRLYTLFQAIEDEPYNAKNVQRSKKELFTALENKNPEIVIFRPNGGDSRTLFQVLASGICEEQSFEENNIFSLFSTGNLEKVVACPNCERNEQKTIKRFSEKLLMLSAQENLFYDQQEPNNFFQPEFEMRTCRVCSERIQHTKKIALQTLPNILAIKIEESSANPTAFQERKPHKCLTFSDSQGTKVNYKFFGGVYNTQRGFDGVHSIAYVMENEDKNAVKYYNDSMAKTVSWDSMYGYPKLLFYCQE